MKIKDIPFGQVFADAFDAYRAQRVTELSEENEELKELLAKVKGSVTDLEIQLHDTDEIRGNLLGQVKNLTIEMEQKHRSWKEKYNQLGHDKETQTGRLEKQVRQLQKQVENQDDSKAELTQKIEKETEKKNQAEVEKRNLKQRLEPVKYYNKKVVTISAGFSEHFSINKNDYSIQFPNDPETKNSLSNLMAMASMLTKQKFAPPMGGLVDETYVSYKLIIKKNGEKYDFLVNNGSYVDVPGDFVVLVKNIGNEFDSDPSDNPIWTGSGFEIPIQPVKNYVHTSNNNYVIKLEICSAESISKEYSTSD